ncbi:uncharacterized protein [Cherax quadricarinatus]|uniref:uncharacterized protein n=1 Tax=Cherax quadricarinatus TaxID=27406 RepID=UPI0023795D48|nr:uncharacterized protein LOC128684506 [Cherax quadricarinatus]
MHLTSIVGVFACVATVVAQYYPDNTYLYPEKSQVTNKGYQQYQAPGVLEPGYGQSGSNDRNVAAILQEVGDFFKLVGNGRSDDPERNSQVMSAFVPFTRKILEAAAGVDGANVSKENLKKLNDAEAVMPSVFTFLDSLRSINYGNNKDYQQSYGQ